ncbi:hypothetical protein J4468_01690 [Candidatus Woesearchaeota archaeon]|nr:hypothetical protein [Candidatus Woesearchaeota archaeon]
MIAAASLYIVENANAVSTLTNPPDATIYTDTRNVTFTCTSNLNPNTNITIYTNMSGSWAPASTQNAAKDATAVFIINNLANGWYSWNCLGANDAISEYAIVNRTFEININNAPSFSGVIPNLNMSEDIRYPNIINLSQYFSGDSLTYSVSGNSKVAISIANALVTLTPQANWSGIEDVVFTASNGGLTSTSNMVRLNVDAVNDPVTFSGSIPGKNWAYGQSIIINLYNYFIDADNETLSFYHSAVNNVTISISSGNATLSSQSGFSGTRYITFYANDTESSANSNNITLVISANNTAVQGTPVIIFYSPSQIVSITEGGSQLFQITATGMGLSYTWSYNGDTASETGPTKNIVTEIGDKGNYTVLVTVSNTLGSASFSWNLIVEDYDNSSMDVNTSLTAGATVEIIDDYEIKTCGNGQIDEGENCFNCDEDVVCTSDEVCMSGQCVPQEDKFPLVRTVVIIIIFLVIGASAIIWIMQSKNKAMIELGLKRNVPPAQRNYDKSYKIISDKDSGENLYGKRPDAQ